MIVPEVMQITNEDWRKFRRIAYSAKFYKLRINTNCIIIISSGNVNPNFGLENAILCHFPGMTFPDTSYMKI